MTTIGKTLNFRSRAFAACDGDRALVNYPAMHGYALARYLADHLPQHGFSVERMVAEDWGWWAGIANPDFELSFGCANYEGEDSYMIITEPDRPTIRRWLRKIDVSEVAEAFDREIFAIISGSEGLIEGPNWEDN